MKLERFCDWLISFSFSALFFLTPLILTPWNYELFEYNKMMMVYALTIIIAGSWLIKMVLQRRILFQRTPFDLPIALFFVSQFLSFLFSIDSHVSLFGYYSRFNGGLFSTISYIFLYYAFVSNIKLGQLVKFVKLGLLSGLVVSLYGIAEHFGIDKNLWMQDVQNRVFSTLGQPNWLGAYLAILIPISISFMLKKKFEHKSENSEYSDHQSNQNIRKIRNSEFPVVRFTGLPSFPSILRISVYYLISALFYLCLLYTKSRSGLAGFGIAFIVFWFLVIARSVTTKQSNLASQGYTLQNLQNFFRPFIVLSTFYFLLSALVGTPWTPSFYELFHRPPNAKYQILDISNGPALEAGGTESGEVRKFVWLAAWDVAKHYPLFGSGVETFAFSFYRFKPVGHNLTSEWDFLYNKAHNEYLNYAATTGFVGLGTYLLFIGWFLIWSFKKMWNSHLPLLIRRKALLISLLAAYISILITNFFGFSVVIISLYFWLIPAMVVIINATMPQSNKATKLEQFNNLTIQQYLIFIVILLAACYLLLTTVKFWYADVRFNAGYQLSRTGYYQQAYQPLHEAIDINPKEPFYRDELSYTDAVLAVAALQQKDATLSAQLAKEAIWENQKALSISPLNVNFYKTQTKVYYTLSSLEPNSTGFNQKALESLQMAKILAPTDPKITYNIALLYGRLGKNKEAIKTLEEAILLKTNYQDARFALALFYHEAGKKKEAIMQLEYILKYISPTDKQIQEKLKEWGN